MSQVIERFYVDFYTAGELKEQLLEVPDDAKLISTDYDTEYLGWKTLVRYFFTFERELPVIQELKN